MDQIDRSSQELILAVHGVGFTRNFCRHLELG
jgi:hypothetical protein